MDVGRGFVGVSRMLWLWKLKKNPPRKPGRMTYASIVSICSMTDL